MNPYPSDLQSGSTCRLGSFIALLRCNQRLDDCGFSAQRTSVEESSGMPLIDNLRKIGHVNKAITSSFCLNQRQNERTNRNKDVCNYKTCIYLGKD